MALLELEFSILYFIQGLHTPFLDRFMTAVTSLQNLHLNLHKFWQLTVLNLTYLKAFVQHLNCHLLFVISTHLLVSW